jgi:hypothetical protein
VRNRRPNPPSMRLAIVVSRLFSGFISRVDESDPAGVPRPL